MLSLMMITKLKNEGQQSLIKSILVLRLLKNEGKF